MSDEKARCPSIDGSPDGGSGQGARRQRADDRAHGGCGGPCKAVEEELRPQPPAAREEDDLPWPHGTLCSDDGTPLVRRVWAEVAPDVYELFLFSREADQVEVGKLLQHERELHGPLGGARGEAGPQPPLVDRVIAVHVVSDLDEVSDEVCRDFVHKSLSAFNRGRSRTNAVYAAAFYACATPLVVLLCAATVAVALAVLRLIPLYR